MADHVPSEMETKADEHQKVLRKSREQLEKVQAQQQEDSRSILKQQKNSERYLTKRQVLLSKKDEAEKKIRDLGVLPEEAFEKYKGVKPDRVWFPNCSTLSFAETHPGFCFVDNEEAPRC